MSVRTVRACPEDEAFGDVVDRIARKMQDLSVCVFTGAGVSRPSGLPDTSKLVKGLADVLCNSLYESGVIRAEQRKSLCNVIEQRRLETILDTMVAVHGDNSIRYLDVLKDAEENFNHKAVARLVAAGVLRYIVTLNFDVLFEQALLGEGMSFECELPLASHTILLGKGRPTARVLKPHGTLPMPGHPYKMYYLSSTLRHAGDRPQAETENAFRAIAKEAPILIVAGYSDEDWDISPILMSIEWDAVYWCQHRNQLPERVELWLKSRPIGSATVIRGDVRELWLEVLGKLGVQPPCTNDQTSDGRWLEWPCREVSTQHLELNTLRSAMAAVALVEEVDRPLYGTLLTAIGLHGSLARDPQLWARWVRARAWYEHIQHRDYRTAIRMRREAMAVPRDGSAEGCLYALEDKVGLYYEHLCVLKRFYRYPLCLQDLQRVASLRGVITKEAQALLKSSNLAPWLVKEIKKNFALADYYVIDLYHDWGYHLLPWGDAVSRYIAHKVFTRISREYERVLATHPSMRWDYHFLRALEAKLLAKIKLDKTTTVSDVNQIVEMLDKTGQQGHAIFGRSLLAILHNNLEAYRTIIRGFISPGHATPAGQLRATLLQRHFWPRSVPMHAAIWDLVRLRQGHARQ